MFCRCQRVKAPIPALPGLVDARNHQKFGSTGSRSMSLGEFRANIFQSVLNGSYAADPRLSRSIPSCKSSCDAGVVLSQSCLRISRDVISRSPTDTLRPTTLASTSTPSPQQMWPRNTSIGTSSLLSFGIASVDMLPMSSTFSDTSDILSSCSPAFSPVPSTAGIRGGSWTLSLHVSDPHTKGTRA